MQIGPFFLGYVEIVPAKNKDWEDITSVPVADERWLVVGESLLPGWQARLDGRSAELVTADRRFIGVAVTPGVHEVVLEYRVPGLVAGVVLSVLGLLCAMVLVLAPRHWPVLRRGERAG